MSFVFSPLMVFSLFRISPLNLSILLLFLSPLNEMCLTCLVRGFLRVRARADRRALRQKKLKSFWSDKAHWSIVEDIEETEESLFNNLWVTAYAFTYLEKRVANVEMIVQGITDKLKVDLSSLRTEVETLHKTIKEPMFAEVFQFVRSVKESAEKAKQAGKQYVE